MELLNKAGNSIKFKYTLLPLKYSESFIGEPKGFRQVQVVERNVQVIKVLDKEFTDMLEWRGCQFRIFRPVI